MEWYLKVLRQYADFDGRARRKEYWMFFLFNILISVALTFVDAALGLYSADTGLGVLSGIYSLLVFVPSLAVGVRRLHDVGKSGWFYFIILIPLIGVIWLLVLFVSDSEDDENIYGKNPKKEAGYL